MDQFQLKETPGIKLSFDMYEEVLLNLKRDNVNTTMSLLSKKLLPPMRRS